MLKNKVLVAVAAIAILLSGFGSRAYALTAEEQEKMYLDTFIGSIAVLDKQIAAAKTPEAAKSLLEKWQKDSAEMIEAFSPENQAVISTKVKDTEEKLEVKLKEFSPKKGESLVQPENPAVDSAKGEPLVQPENPTLEVKDEDQSEEIAAEIPAEGVKPAQKPEFSKGFEAPNTGAEKTSNQGAVLVALISGAFLLTVATFFAIKKF